MVWCLCKIIDLFQMDVHVLRLKVWVKGKTVRSMAKRLNK